MLELDRQVVDLGIERDSLKARLAHREGRIKELEAEVAVARVQSETHGEEREHSHDLSREVARLRAEREDLEKELERVTRKLEKSKTSEGDLKRARDEKAKL